MEFVFGAAMKGVKFLVNEAGDKTAVILDLRKHRRIWEDMYDRMLVDSRKNEPRESLEQVKKRLNARRVKSHA
jgi:hypothetical protein